MPSNQEPPEPRDQLWERFLLGNLDDAGAQDLLTWLEGDAKELERRRVDASLSAGLSYLLAPPKQTEQLVLSVQARLKGAKAGVPSGRFAGTVMKSLKRKTVGTAARERRSHQNFLWPAMAASVLLAGLIVFYLAKRTPSEPVAANPPPPPLPAPQPEPSGPAPARLSVRAGSVALNGVSIGPSKTAVVLPNARAVLEPGALATLTLADGSTLELSEHAAVTLLEPKRGPRALLESGQAVVSAKKQADGTSLTLETPHAAAAVVGTRYTARVFANLSTVSVAEGRVAVSPKAGGEAKQALLTAGEEVRASTAGLGMPLRSSGRRPLELQRGIVEQYTDPATASDLPGELFNGLAIRRLVCLKPRGKESFTYSGLAWPVTLSDGEDRIEMWIRPRSVKPFTAQASAPMLILLAKLGTTDYRIGELRISPADKDWMLLSGRIDESAALNWVQEQTKQQPLRVDRVQQIAVRTAYAEFEFDHTAPVIWKK